MNLGRLARVAYVSMGAASTVFLAVYYVFLEPAFLSYGNLPFPVLTPEVHPGQPVLLKVHRCNSDKVTRVYGVSHRMIGPETLLLPASPTSIEPGCHEGVSALNVVPLGAKPGIYRVRGTAEVQATIRAVTVQWYSEPFEVK